MPPAAPGDCAAERFEDMRTLCWIQTAATKARQLDEKGAARACDAVTDGAWAQECWFRTGEELGAGGNITAAMRACANAGQYASFCVTHAGWRSPPTDEPLSTWQAAADLLPGTQRAEAAALLPGRWWFNHYFGTGEADPSLATDPIAKTAWALEAVRLVDGDLAAARKAFTDKTVLRGSPLPQERRLGRYDLGIRVEGEATARHVPVFGGAARLVGDTDEEDLEIALLEAAYFREVTTAETFRPYLFDRRQKVRWTAVRLFRTLPAPDAEAVMTSLAADVDPVVQAHAKDALQYRTWEGKPNAPGLRKPRSH